MNKSEVAKLLDEISAVDNRIVGPEQVEAWHKVIGHIPLDIAQEALVMARRDERTNYLEPRHIITWAKEAAFKLDRQAGRDTPEEPQGQFVPQPKCKHQKGIIDCAECTRELAQLADRPKNEILIYAKKNVYA